LKKKNPTLATCDILQHLGHLCGQLVCHLDGVEPRLEQSKAPEETSLSQGAGQGIGKISNQRRQHIPKTPVSAAIIRTIQEEDAGAPSARPSEPTTPNKYLK
jgi:hypothetical protein